MGRSILYRFVKKLDMIFFLFVLAFFFAHTHTVFFFNLITSFLHQQRKTFAAACFITVWVFHIPFLIG